MTGSAPAVGFLTACRFRMNLWLAARSLPWRVAGKSFEQILAMASPEGRLDYAGLPVEYVSRRVRKAVRHPWLMRDLRRNSKPRSPSRRQRRSRISQGWRTALRTCRETYSTGSPA